MPDPTLKLGIVYREAQLDRAAADTEARTIPLSFSSEEPVERWWGKEILDHSPGAVRLERLQSGGSLLVDHNSRDLVGVVEDVSIGSDRIGRAVVRFGKSARAEEIYQDVLDDIRKGVSVRYRIHKAVLEETGEDQPDVYRVTDWEPLEISMASIPADISVGVGRSDDEKMDVEITRKRKEGKMPDKKTTATPGTESTEGAGQIQIRTEPTPQPPVPPAPSVDVNSVREEARREELVRVKEIRAITKSLSPHVEGLTDQAEQFIDDGRSAEEFRKEAIKQIASKPIETSPAHLGLSQREVEEYSLFRAILAQLSGDWRDAGFELECSRTLAEKREGRPKGFLVPLDIPFGGERTLTAGTATTGAEMVATQHLAANFIDALRQRLFVIGLGAQILPGLVGNIEIPSMGDATFYHVGEDVDITDSTPATAEVSLTPKTLGGSVPMSRRFLKQSTPAAEGLVRNLLVRGAAVEMEAKILNGSGAAGQPTGVLNTTGVATSTIATPGQPTWAELVEFETDVLTAKALAGNLAYLITPAVQGHCKTTLKASGVAGYLMEGGDINGYKSLATTNMPTNGILFGNYEEIIIGMWGGMDVKPDEATKAAAGGLVIRVFLDYDVGVGHAAGFSKNA